MTKKLKKRIDKITNQIVAKYKPEKVILFGSAATGKFEKHSDVDLFIIKDDSRRFVDRIGDVLSTFEHNLPVDVVVYTPSEVKKAREENRIFLEQVLNFGKVLYEKT